MLISFERLKLEQILGLLEFEEAINGFICEKRQNLGLIYPRLGLNFAQKFSEDEHSRISG
jgi:hypothetical protein